MNFLTVLLAACVAACVQYSVNALPAKQADWDAVLRRRRDTADCQPPNNVETLFTNLNNSVDVNFFLRQARDIHWPSYLPNELNIDQLSVSDVYGSGTCPETVSDDPKDPLWMRSLCPWHYNITQLPEGTFPKVIPQAICKCSNCIDNNVNQCEQVHTEIRILEQKGCHGGFFVYEPRTIRLSVGCTCAKRRMTTSAPQPDCGGWPCAS